MILFTKKKSNYLFFLLGILFTISLFPIFFINRKLINTFLGRWPIPYLESTIDQPQNYDWYYPSKNHFIKSKKELISTRNNLYSYIINRPKYYINSIKVNKIFKFRFLNNLSEIEKIDIKHQNGINTNAYYFRPKKSINRLLIFHQGDHIGSTNISKEALKYFNKKGYHIIFFQMPLNSKNAASIDNLNGVKTKSHDVLIRFNSEEKSFISFFVTPVVLSLDYVLKNNTFDSISMTGISGGGWNTVLSSAVDNRIDFSFPISGTLPLDLMNSFEIGETQGSKERNHASFYRKYPYLDLYLLGSTGENRHQVQITINKDPGGYSGGRTMLYADYLNSLSRKLNGSFHSIELGNGIHEVSELTSEFIHEKISLWTKNFN